MNEPPSCHFCDCILNSNLKCPDEETTLIEPCCCGCRQTSKSAKRAGQNSRETVTCTSLSERRGWTQSSAAGTSVLIWSALSPQRSNTSSTVSNCWVGWCLCVKKPLEVKHIVHSLFSHSECTRLPVDWAE